MSSILDKQPNVIIGCRTDVTFNRIVQRIYLKKSDDKFKFKLQYYNIMNEREKKRLVPMGLTQKEIKKLEELKDKFELYDIQV